MLPCSIAQSKLERQYAVHVSNTLRLYLDVSEPEPINLITLRSTE